MKDEPVGLDIEIFNAIISQASFSAGYVELPWKRHLKYLESGEIDIAMGSSFTKEREQFVYFSLPYRTEKVNLFIRKELADKMKLLSLSDIIDSNYLFGIEDGYYYGQEFQELYKEQEFKSHISSVLDLEQNVQMLLKGRLDGFFADPIAVKAFAEKFSISNVIEIHPLDIHQADIYFMLSKKSLSTDILLALNKAIKKLKANGEIDKIIRKWTVFEPLNDALMNGN